MFLIIVVAVVVVVSVDCKSPYAIKVFRLFVGATREVFGVGSSLRLLHLKCNELFAF